MHRAFAILLLIVFSLSLITPALFADSESKLPACCRKDGKHHCAMMDMGTEQSKEPALKNRETKCPFFPSPAPPEAFGKAVAHHPGDIFYASILSHPAAHAQTEARYRVSFSRSSQKRGPPSLFS